MTREHTPHRSKLVQRLALYGSRWVDCGSTLAKDQRERVQLLKKLVVAVLIIGTFTLYSLTHQPPGSSALAPIPTVDTAAVATTASTSVASSVPPTAMPSPTPTANVQPTATTNSVPSPTPTPTSILLPTPRPTPTVAVAGSYKDGSYTGRMADAQWGYVQVQVNVSQGHIAQVQFLKYPSDRSRSVRINQFADPVLVREAIQAQSAQVDIVTGATDSSEAFIQSLTDALSQAQG